MSTFSKRALYQLSRTKNFLKLFTRKTMGILGLVIIALFAITALGSSYIAKHDPVLTTQLSSSRAAPTWLRQLPPYLGGIPTLSENFYVVKDSGFSSSGSLNEWNMTTNGTGIITWEYEPNFGDRENGSIHVSYSRDNGSLAGNYTFILVKQFHFPYSGPPKGFSGTTSFFINGSGIEYTKLERFKNQTSNQIETRNVTVILFDVPVKVTLFMGLVNEVNWTLLPIPGVEMLGVTDGVAVEYRGKWVSGRPADTELNLNQMFKKLTNQDSLPSMFPANRLPADYFYGMQLTFLDSNVSEKVNTEFYIDDLSMWLSGSSWGLLGTDHMGRDIFSQLVVGARLSLYVGLLSSFLSVVLGLIVGLLAGYLGRYADEILMRFTDMLLVIPSLPLLIVLSAVVGYNLENLIIIIGFLGWMSFARLVRSQVLSLKERPFIEAAKAAGAGKLHILTSHIIPNVASLVYVSLATSVPTAIVSEAALAFLGFADPLRISWGKMLADAQAAGAWQNWWWIVTPGLCIALLSMAFIFLGYALDEVLNPRLRIRK